MEEDTKTLKIRQFDGKNFNNWCFRMKVYLEQLEVMHCVEKAAEKEPFWIIPETDTADKKAEKEQLKLIRVRQDKKCRMVLVGSIADDYLEYAKDKKSPKEIWDGLHEVFERKSLTNRFILKRELLSLRFREGERLEDHFLRFDKLVRQIKGAGAKMDDEDVICHLMLSMPESFDAITTAMEAVTENLTMDLVRKRYLDVEAKRKSLRQETESEDAAFSGRTRTKLKCYGCGEFGHKKVNCPKNRDHHKSASRFQPKKSGPKANVSKAVTFVATEERDDAIAASVVTSTKWYLDSGASEHMCNDRSLFDSLEKLDKPVTVQTAKSGVTLSAFHCGRVVAFAAVDGASVRVNIEKVLFIPDLSVNLLSLRKMGESGLKVVFFNGTVIVENDGQTVAVGKQSGRLYCMDFDFKLQQRNGKAMVTGQVNKQVGLWHLRYGHLGNDNLLKLAKKNLVSGMQIDGAGHERLLCEPCISGKLTRLPFPPRQQKHSGRPLEIVHSDVCGPIDPVSWDGNRYFVSFTDDYTHLAVVYLLRSKSEVLERLREYEAMATAHFGTKMSRLRCDNGGEYTGEGMKRFCKQRGIRLEFTVPYTPEQNGVSERLNRTVVEKVRAMMEAKSVPKFLWGEAVYTAVYLLNRSPSVAVAGEVTPFEAWSSRKPDVSHLRVFGSECYIHVPKQLRKKLDVKSEKVLFVGYAPNGYRVWNGEKVFVARDAIFNETELRPCTVTNCNRPEIVTVTEPVSVESRTSPKPEEGASGHEEEPPSLPEGGAEEGNDSEYFTEGSDADEEENSEQAQEESAPAAESESGKSKSGRSVIPPSWHKDYDMNLSSFALSAEEFIDNIPSDIGELRKRSDWPSWEEAIKEELSALKKNKTWHLVKLPAGRKVIDTKWVFKLKRNSAGEVERYKARLVARGFTQRQGFDFTETYSPVVRMTTVRILLVLANRQDWHVHQMDVKCAFLNGGLEEDIFMRQPAGFEEGVNLVCKLDKAIYGLKQASRNWNKRFHEFVSGLGFRRSEHDFCLYFRVTGKLVMYVVIYVDDILLVSSSENAIRDLKLKLSDEFEMRDLQEVQSFLGLNIRRDRSSKQMTIDQSSYVKSVLDRFGMADCKPSAIPMDPHLKLVKGDQQQHTEKPYRELVGCLMYLTVTSRPDISAAVNYLAGFQCSATEEHWVTLKRVLRYLRGTIDYRLVYRSAESSEAVEGFADADWGNDPNDRRSVSGLIVKLYGSTVTWATRKQQSVALSTTEAELMALCQASCEVMWLVNLLSSIGWRVPEPIKMYEDNQPCISITKDPRKARRMKHIEIQHFFVRDLVDKGKLCLEYLPTEDQLADVMTKGLAAPRFQKLRSMLGVIN